VLSVVALVAAATGGLLAGRGCAPSHGRLSRVLAPKHAEARPARARVARLSATASVDVPAALAAELRAGRELAAAMTTVAGEQGAESAVGRRLLAGAAAARSGNGLRAAMLGGSTAHPDPAADALSVTAACCAAAHRSGVALAELLESASSAARSHWELEQEAAAELAGVRSSVVVLAALPLVGLLMGQALGARPLDVLLSTGWGVACLLGSALLEALGCWWLRRIGEGALRAIR
jgi:tight adherence protein B